MTYDQNCSSLLRHILHLPEAFFLKLRIPDRKHLIHDKDLRLEVGGHGESEANIHPRTVAFNRGIEKFLDLGEGYDFIEPPFDLLLSHPEDRTVKKDVLPTCQLRMEASAHLE